MTRIGPSLATLGASTGGTWSRAKALEVVSPGQLRRWLDDGTWQSPWPGVYADGGIVLDHVQRAWAAVIASGGEDQPAPFGAPLADGRRRQRLRAVACGRTAARLHGLPLIDDDDPVTGGSEHLLDDVKVWEAARPLQGRSPGSVLQRHRFSVAGSDLVRLPSGLWVTSVARTVVDCSSLLAVDALACLVDAALFRHALDEEQLRGLAAARHGLVGGPALADVARTADRRAESPGETLARRLLRPHLPGLQPQVRLRVRGQVVRRFDLADEEAMLALEVDGKQGHAGEAMAAKDHAHDRTARACGWSVERARRWELRRQQTAPVARVLAEHRRCLARRTG